MNMKQKTPDQKRTRRNRYINAIEPFREKYKCTAAQVFDIIQGVERHNAELRDKLDAANKHLNRIHKQGMELIQKEPELPVAFVEQLQIILKSFDV